jgi:hypothetical protein
MAFLAGLLLAASTGFGQQAPTQNNSESAIQQRIDQLEAEIKQLQEKQAATPPAPAPAPEPAVEAPAVNEVAPRLKLAIFGDVGAQKYSHIASTFMFGSLDLFMRARLADKVSVLGEVLFIASNDNNIQPDVERLYLQYRQNDYFSVSGGRMHSWIGYYNTAYNYGEFLETATDRPYIYAFDDQGGVLPMQEIGVNVTGKIPSGKLGLNYVVEAGNGRGWGPNAQPAQNNQDANNSKSINGGLYVRPEALPGLQAGFSLRYDQLTVPGPEVHETIATTHVVFVNPTYEILNEGVWVRHVLPVGPVFNTTAFYTQLARSWGPVRPYVRYQYFNSDSNDPVFQYAGISDFQPRSATAFVGRLNGPSLGVRYDFTQHSAFKFQYDRMSLRGSPDVNGYTAQIAFTF